MAVNIEAAIAWMSARVGKVTYSMDYRNGPRSYDCSSSVYYALMSAGAISAGLAAILLLIDVKELFSHREYTKEDWKRGAIEW